MPSRPKTKYDTLVVNGKEHFVLVPVKDYRAMCDRLEDDRDYHDLQAAKKRNAGQPPIPLG